MEILTNTKKKRIFMYVAICCPASNCRNIFWFCYHLVTCMDVCRFMAGRKIIKMNVKNTKIFIRKII